QVGSPILGALVGYAFFYLVYRTVPRRRPPRRLAVQAALVSAVLWEVAKLAFAFFTRALEVFAVYGPLAFAAGLLTWIYVTAVIILIGAEVVKTRGAACGVRVSADRGMESTDHRRVDAAGYV